MFPPKPSDSFPPEGGCSEGLDAFRFLLNTIDDVLSISCTRLRVRERCAWNYHCSSVNSSMILKQAMQQQAFSAFCVPCRLKTV